MSGIVFFSTEQREAVVEFYTETVGASVWLEQPDCTILDYDGFRFGFCQRETTDDCGILTFVFDDKAGVDEAHEAVGDAATETPHENETYEIYQFFAEDPDGRTAEFQTFLHDLPES
ncbi:hypothetical protein SAMN05216226_107104 [Halovenus aranensis]|jgi:hypothetical protein|uniref:VOC domain-containing protein n=1 Tax=Halovenus aranensis TaxID=890420 RepID=A0A1G8VRD2_9EURY|nr:VOC family protein [Halovenus aranensis]SDJ68453.1 hypothetical protein SAMN05216226_107104 [Halovenus aranensis]